MGKITFLASLFIKYKISFQSKVFLSHICVHALQLTLHVYYTVIPVCLHDNTEYGNLFDRFCDDTAHSMSMIGMCSLLFPNSQNTVIST